MVQMIRSNFYLLQSVIVLRTARFKETTSAFSMQAGPWLWQNIYLWSGHGRSFPVTFAQEDPALGDEQMSSRQDWNANASLQLSQRHSCSTLALMCLHKAATVCS